MKALPLASQRLATHSAISPSFRVVCARTSNYEQHVRFTSCGPFGPETSSGSWAKKVVWNRRKPSPRLVPAWLSEGQGRHLRVGLEGVFPWGIKPGQGIPRSRAFRRRCVPFKPGQGILRSIRRHVIRHRAHLAVGFFHPTARTARTARSLRQKDLSKRRRGIRGF